MNIDFSIPEVGEGYSQLLAKRYDEKCLVLMSELPIWHQNLLINIPHPSWGSISSNPEDRIERIKRIEECLKKLINKEGWNDSYRRTSFETLEWVWKWARSTPSDVMKIWEVVDLVFPFKNFWDERLALISELSQYVGYEWGENAYDDTDFYIDFFKDDLHADWNKIDEFENRCQIVLSELKEAVWGGRAGLYSTLAVMVWERYLTEQAQRTHASICQIFEYQESDKKIQTIAKELKGLSGKWDKQIAIISYLRSEDDPMSKRAAHGWCQKRFPELFGNIVFSSFGQYWAAGVPEKQKSG